MTKLGPYEVHPFADRFPLLDAEALAELTADVKTNGLRVPILLSEDSALLIDGRNRYLACDASGVDPVFESLPADYTEQQILDLIVSANVHRRHLDAGQLAFLGADYERFYAAAARTAEAQRKSTAVGDRNSHHGDSASTRTVADLPQSQRDRKSRERAARAVGASGRGIQQAKALERDAPDLAELVRSRQMALDRADKLRRERLRREPQPEPPSGPVLLTLHTHEGSEVKYPKPLGKAVFNASPGEGISWAQWSWNPVTGCLHGCDYCYAREIATSERFKAAYPAGFTPLFHPERLDAPRNTVIPASHRDDPAWQRVFVCSMSDLYGRWVPAGWIEQVHASMLASPQWQYILLTKFPARYVGLQLPPAAWVGTSVDEQRRVRIAENAFRQIDGMVRWLSLEPLREPLVFSDLSMFDWIVIGAQTETRQPTGTVPAFAPPFDWVARLVAQAREAGCKVHLKPNLLGRPDGKSPGMTLPDEYPPAAHSSLDSHEAVGGGGAGAAQEGGDG